ncbi:MAG: hypothetical protein QNK56_04200 [Pontimonas sp.]|jgi:uncharacterized protein YdhG (YjbR/CyaY superfamily)|tara:strand:+ start:1027 stop:1452 length:426 start_codon:yes stop_codon:yes gene_type:complete
MADKEKSSSVFSDQEREAMRERAREQREFKKLPGEEQVQRKIAEMAGNDKKLALGIHALVMGISPEITTKTWYGMPAYYLGDTVICFYQAGSKFDSRYSTFGFQEAARLDDGSFWPTSYAITELTNEVAKKITGLVKKAIA